LDDGVGRYFGVSISKAIRVLRAMPFQITGLVQIFRVKSSAGAELVGERMAVVHAADVPQPPQSTAQPRSTGGDLILPGLEVIREGRVEPFLHAHPALSSVPVRWAGVAVEDYSLPALVIPRHEHVENFLQVVVRGSVKYEVQTRGKTLRFGANPGTIFILPRGTVDELRWGGPTRRIAVAMHPSLLVNALEETAHESSIELAEHWNLSDRHIMAVLLAMTAELAEGSPAGRLYGESLANALAVYLLNRYTVRRYAPVAYRGGLPGYRLKRVLDHIGDNVAGDLSLSQLAAIAGMSPHYFAELFKQSTGRAPHQYVLLQRIERAKQSLRHPKRSVIEAGLDAGFQNPSHFARMFRKFVGISPSEFQADILSRRQYEGVSSSRSSFGSRQSSYRRFRTILG
jgi:AraC family transcriptional regulator